MEVLFSLWISVLWLGLIKEGKKIGRGIIALLSPVKLSKRFENGRKDSPSMFLKEKRWKSAFSTRKL